MSVNKIENNNKTRSFPNIKIITLGVLLVTSIIGGLCYYFISNKKPSEEPVKEVIEDNQETENNNQNNNEENIENKEEEKQEEVIINNEYIPVIDCLWLNILFFVIIAVVAFCIVLSFFKEDDFEVPVLGFKPFEDPTKALEKVPLAWTKSIVVFILLQQVILYIIWFIFMLIFAAFSKIWDKEHSWWSNVVKGFFRNRIHRGWLSLIPISLIIIAIVFFVIYEIFG